MEKSTCGECGFKLFDIIAFLKSSELAFVDDSRYPGRCILGLNFHAESIESLSPGEYFTYFTDLRVSVKAIRLATGCDRVNIYLLGNREPHLHFHLVPRFGEFTSDYPPTHFNDNRRLSRLSSQDYRRLVRLIQDSLD